MKRAISLITVLCVTLSSMLSVSASGNSNLSAPDPVDEIIDSLDPDTYGGVYIRDDGKTCITVIDSKLVESKVNRATTGLRSALKADKVEIVYESATFSRQQLTDAKEDLLKRQEELNITAVGFEDSKNALAIFVPKVTEEAKSTISAATPIKNLEFFEDGFLISSFKEEELKEETTEAPQDTLNTLDSNALSSLTVKGGNWISNTRGGEWASLGYAVNYYGSSSTPIKGYITCAHGFGSKGSSIYYGNSLLGTVENRIRDTKVDALFIKSSATWGGMRDRTLKATGAIGAKSKQKIYMVGAASGNLKSGTIIATDVAGKWNDGNGNVQKHEDLFAFDFQPIHGDSGSALFVKTSGGKYKIAGLTVGQNPDDDGKLTHGAGCKWTNIIREMDVEIRNS